MYDTMTAVMGLLGAAIFLAHAFEGIRSRGFDLSGMRKISMLVVVEPPPAKAGGRKLLTN